MNRLGIQSLNAGAPDLRLTGDQTQRGTYVQRRRNQMAGGGIMGSNAGSMLVAPTADGSRPGYGWLGDAWDWTKEKVGKLIPNELKNPLGATAAAVAANYLPKAFGADTVLTQLGKLPVIGPVAETIGNIGTGIGDIIKGPDEEWGGVDIFGLPGRIGDAITPDMSYTLKDGTKVPINYGIPMAIGAGAGLAQKKYLEDQPPFPMDETGIKFQTGAEAMADPTLRFKPKAEYADVAEGGRIGYRLGGNEKEKNIFRAWDAYKSSGGQREFQGWFKDVWFPMSQGLDEPMDSEDWRSYATQPDDEWPAGFAEPGTIGSPEAIGIEYNAQGGRIGYANGRGPHFEMPTFSEGVEQEFPSNELGMSIEEKLRKFRESQSYKRLAERMARREFPRTQSPAWPGGRELLAEDIGSWELPEGLSEAEKKDAKQTLLDLGLGQAQGGRIGADEGGLMNLGGMEKDYRQEGGFVPLGGEEKADDVPARLSKNEFVFTADAVRNAGGGDVDAGAEVMENLMEHLEAGGEVSEDSQGLEGARGMFANAQQLEKRII
jgi:hypothetical protein